MDPGASMRLVISAVNFTEGGPLTVLRDVVRAAADHFPRWSIYVLVHAIGTVDTTGSARIIELPYPAPKRSWLRRLHLEWFEFRRLSRELRPEVWLSLHDITPRVEAGRQYVYCHNPAPFCAERIPAERHDRRFMLFRRFYGALYRCFIHRNTAVIVQQDWLREQFRERFGVRRVIVAYPDVPRPVDVGATPRGSLPAKFLYPAFPRVFKNFELLGECVSILERDARWKGEMIVTIDGSENSYAREIRERYGHLRTLRFVGLQPPERLADLYANCDALVFPSLLETWGLPLTEAKSHRLPILAADRPYAHETVGSCDRVTFFDPIDAEALASRMLELHTGVGRFGSAEHPSPEAPFANGWKQLLEILLVQHASTTARGPIGYEHGN
jgi:glycosyltransferase involved in cell wall biosynthesis